MVDDAVEGRVRRDGDARVRLEAGWGVNVDLDPRAVECVVRRRGGTMEDEDGEVAEEGVGGVVEGDMLGRKRQLLRHTNHDVCTPIDQGRLLGRREEAISRAAGLSRGRRVSSRPKKRSWAGRIGARRRQMKRNTSSGAGEGKGSWCAVVGVNMERARTGCALMAGCRRRTGFGRVLFAGALQSGETMWESKRGSPGSRFLSMWYRRRIKVRLEMGGRSKTPGFVYI